MNFIKIIRQYRVPGFGVRYLSKLNEQWNKNQDT